MPNLTLADLQGEIQANVRTALAEDVGGGDLTAQLIDPQREAEARVITREHATIAGRAWVDEVFRQVDPRVLVTWQVEDGQRVEPNQMLFQLKGPARALLTGERSALNFLQLLSGTATRSQHYADLVAGTAVKLLDTRKTLPGLRLAQKYAVTCGGCHNHRIGLYDAFLIKENHIAACGGIDRAIAEARRIAPGKPVEVEVENLDELRQALRPAPISSCSTSSAWTTCAPPSPSPPAVPSWKLPAESTRAPCATSPRPASTTSPSAP